MTGWVLAPRARADIESIWTYTVERWGLDQAERYVRDLQVAIEGIARDPQRGAPSDDIRAGYRRLRCGAHVLFYRPAEPGVEIVRILHGSMDVDRHL